jgi:hypothetical protein
MDKLVPGFGFCILYSFQLARILTCASRDTRILAFLERLLIRLPTETNILLLILFRVCQHVSILGHLSPISHIF